MSIRLFSEARSRGRRSFVRKSALVAAGALLTSGFATAPAVSAGSSCAPTTVLLPVSGVTAHEYSPFCRLSPPFRDTFAKVDFRMQDDGNMVVYSTGSGSRALWASNTAGHPGAYADIQSDGNLVIYDPTRQVLWASNTAGRANCVLAVQSDGNVVLYQRTSGSGLRAIWATNTNH
jgi:hypothetical protein